MFKSLLTIIVWGGVVFTSFWPSYGVAQELSMAEKDSVQRILLSVEHDTTKLKHFIKWEKSTQGHSSALSLKLNNIIDSIADVNLKTDPSKKLLRSFKKAKAHAMNSLGLRHQFTGDPELGLEYHEKGMQLYKELGIKKGVANSKSNIGIIFQDKGLLDQAIEYHSEALKIREALSDSLGMAISYLSLGPVYEELGEPNTAMKYYENALEIFEGLEDQYGIAGCYHNMAIIARKQGDLNRAIELNSSTLSIMRQIRNQSGISGALNSLGACYFEQGNIQEAISYFQQSSSLAEKIGDPFYLSSSLIGLSDCYRELGDYPRAIKYGKKAVDISLEHEISSNIRDGAGSLYQSYRDVNQYSKSLEMYELFISTRDSLDKKDHQKAALRNQFQHQYEKQALEDSVRSAEAAKVKDAEIAKQDAEINAKENEQYMLYGGLSLVIVFSIFIFNRFRVTSRQKDVIEEQRDIVEEKNKEILDSINYAKRLQDAILPAPGVVKEYLGDSFILYKPKDIVAGDFYWLETIGATNNYSSQQPPSSLQGYTGGSDGRSASKASDAKGWTYIAAADCTGHGVPGAMVSVVCSNALTKALVEEGITDTGRLLDRTRELVISQFAASDEDIKDGMDISLAAIRHDGKQVRWSGANNPLWVLRGNEVLETKPDKQPIGKYAAETPFTQHTIDLNEGDTLYMFSDGYPDQFGGERGKKYKSGKLKKLLLSIQHKSMDDQKRLLDEEFESWRGELEQIDDVCVIGVRL